MTHLPLLVWASELFRFPCAIARPIGFGGRDAAVGAKGQGFGAKEPALLLLYIGAKGQGVATLLSPLSLTAMSQGSSSYGGAPRRRVLCPNCNVLANRFISTTRANPNRAFHKCPYFAVCASLFGQHCLSFPLCSVSMLDFRLEDVSTISGRMRWGRQLHQSKQFHCRQWQHLVVFP